MHVPLEAGPDWQILPLAAVSDHARALTEIDLIFFGASATQAFTDPTARAQFRERWLGRYLMHDPDLVFVALSDAGAVIGYILGAAVDPATLERFADLPFTASFAPLSREYPAHLHVNCASGWRGRGIGAALARVFAAAVKQRGATGLHLVTGAASRNRAFYQREGFVERGRWGEPGKDVVFLAKPL